MIANITPVKATDRLPIKLFIADEGVRETGGIEAGR